MLLFAQLFALKIWNHYKHDVGVFAEHLKEHPSPPILWQTCKVLHLCVIFCETTILEANLK